MIAFSCRWGGRSGGGSKSMPEITEIYAREILDSRGRPTLEVEVHLDSGFSGRAAVPSGISTGTREARELRDGDPGRYDGRGVLRAVGNVMEEIGPALAHCEVLDQAGIDQTLCDLDGTESKERLGANAILGTSLAVSRAAASVLGIPLYRYLGGVGACLLPVPMLNLLNGGAHASNNLDVQEFMVVPVGFDTFGDAIHAGVRIYNALGALLVERGLSAAVGDEGGFAPDLPSNEEALRVLLAAVERAGYRPGEEVALAVDVAATELKDEGSGTYYLAAEGHRMGASDMIDLYRQWLERYPLVSIEDGLAEDDWKGWAELTEAMGDQVQLVGDDLFVTNVSIIARGIQDGIANAVLVKPNQIGTLSETLEAMRVAAAAGYQRVVSHRSGETGDAFIADLAVATSAGQIKAGAPARGERTAKYNRLLEIELELGEAAVFASDEAYCPGEME